MLIKTPHFWRFSIAIWRRWLKILNFSRNELLNEFSNVTKLQKFRIKGTLCVVVVRIFIENDVCWLSHFKLTCKTFLKQWKWLDGDPEVCGHSYFPSAWLWWCFAFNAATVMMKDSSKTNWVSKGLYEPQFYK